MKQKLLFLAVMALLSLRMFSQVVINPVDKYGQCNNEVFNLHESTIPIMLEGQDPADFIVDFFYTQAAAEANMDAIGNPAIVMTTQNMQIWVRVTNIATAEFAIDTFVIFFQGSPLINPDDHPDVTACGAYGLPQLPSWAYNYNTGPNGSGTWLQPGALISESMTIYVNYQDGVCFDETSFEVTVTESSVIMPPFDSVLGCRIGDTIGIFDLTPVVADVFELNPDAAISIHLTANDAQFGDNPIENLETFQNTTPWQQMVFIRIAAEECTVVVPIWLKVTTCPTDNTISGRVTFDTEGDGCTELDPAAGSVLVFYVHENTIYHTYTDSEGYYHFTNVPSGNVQVYADLINPNPVTAEPASYQLIIDGSEENINFCLTATEPSADAAVYVWPSSGAQPGFDATYTLVYQNLGTLPVSGDISLQFDDDKLDFVTASPGMTHTGNTLTMSYTDLQPFESRFVELTFTVMVPPTVEMGDILTFNAHINPEEGDHDITNNTHVLEQVAVNSWDPNDIAVLEGEFISEDQAENYLHYKIRFQNMGNANAVNVRLENFLDANLDAATFQPLESSDEYQIMRDGSDLQIVFNNIQLPGAMVNEEESHGHFSYRIKPVAGLEIGDSMSAQTDIFFDFNAPVPTNTVTTTIEPPAGLQDLNSDKLSVWPNPATDRVMVQLKDLSGAAINVTDVLGKSVLRTSMPGSEIMLDVSSLKGGVYFINVTAGDKQLTYKLVVK